MQLVGQIPDFMPQYGNFENHFIPKTVARRAKNSSFSVGVRGSIERKSPQFQPPGAEGPYAIFGTCFKFHVSFSNMPNF